VKTSLKIDSLTVSVEVETPSRRIHYAGALRYRSGRSMTTDVGAGYAACCSGDAARLVRRLGNHTYDRAAVTCKRCLAAIAREVKP